jgi:hypothetical protein
VTETWAPLLRQNLQALWQSHVVESNPVAYSRPPHLIVLPPSGGNFPMPRPLVPVVGRHSGCGCWVSCGTTKGTWPSKRLSKLVNAGWWSACPPDLSQSVRIVRDPQTSNLPGTVGVHFRRAHIPLVLGLQTVRYGLSTASICFGPPQTNTPFRRLSRMILLF